ncbi:MAG TPA: FeoA family protein [Verrucomicrobiae bacterium]|nr:FeoA family protein [Verrucomicrobiae bacterium]
METYQTTPRAHQAEAPGQTCPLNRVEAGVAVRIKKLCVPPHIQFRLRELGFCEEQIIRLLTTRTNYICLVCNTRLALSGQLAKLIVVEPLQAFGPA